MDDSEQLYWVWPGAEQVSESKKGGRGCRAVETQSVVAVESRGSTAAPKGHTAIGREECISQFDGQTLVAGLRNLLDSAATTQNVSAGFDVVTDKYDLDTCST